MTCVALMSFVVGLISTSGFGVEPTPKLTQVPKPSMSQIPTLPSTPSPAITPNASASVTPGTATGSQETHVGLPSAQEKNVQNKQNEMPEASRGVFPQVVGSAAADFDKPIDIDDILKKRDPFKRPAGAKVGSKDYVSELERYDINTLKLVGVMAGDPVRLRAMLVAPDGKTFVVSKNQRIGTRKGSVVRITEDAIFVSEKVTNLLGKSENVITEISLVSEEEKK